MFRIRYFLKKNVLSTRKRCDSNARRERNLPLRTQQTVEQTR